MGCGNLRQMFSHYLIAWDLTPDGSLLATHSSRLLPVRQRGSPAMLKIALETEEKSGAALMEWWEGEGAARVLARDDNAILMERADDDFSLAELSEKDADDEAMKIMCALIAKLHTSRSKPLPVLVPLSRWFRDLWSTSAGDGSVLSFAAVTACELLDSPRGTVVLHGDMHHGNVLHFAQRGWLAIDPKGLIGERGFDYVNMFCNPDHQRATNPDRFKRRVQVVSAAANLERTRLLKWILAWAGLSATWFLNDGSSPKTPLGVAELAAAELSM